MGIFQYDCICGNSIEEILTVALPKVKCKCGKYARKIVSLPGYRRDHTMCED